MRHSWCSPLDRFRLCSKSRSSERMLREYPRRQGLGFLLPELCRLSRNSAAPPHRLTPPCRWHASNHTDDSPPPRATPLKSWTKCSASNKKWARCKPIAHPTIGKLELQSMNMRQMRPHPIFKLTVVRLATLPLTAASTIQIPMI